MRLAFVSTMAKDAWGGSEELWFAAAHAALDAGHSVLLSTFDWGQQPRLQALTARGAVRFPRPRRSSRIGGWLGLQPAWLTHLNNWNPDAVLVSQGSAYECVARRATRPLLGWLVRSGTPFLSVSHLNKEMPKDNPRVRALVETYCRTASGNLFVTERHLRQAEAFVGHAIKHAGVVRNPVNLTDASALPMPEIGERSPIRLACVGRLLLAHKGQDLLLGALAAPHWRNRDWTLSFAGSGPDEQRLHNEVARLDLTGRVQFMGHVADVRDFWKAHHLLVLPSHNEGAPLALVEAMLLGRPAVVTDVGGMTEWVTEPLTGWVAPRAEVSSIGDALQRAWDHRSAWDETGRAARTAALRHFDPTPGRTLLAMLESLQRSPAA